LASGASDVTNASRTVAAGDPDPLVNSASVTCSPTGFPNVLTASDSHSVNLFQPSIEVSKDCTPKTVQVGGVVEYTCTITNTSSADSPNLILDSLIDVRNPGNVTTDLEPAANAQGCDVLTPGEVCTVTYTFTTTAQGIVTNEVTAHYHPDGFPNDISDSATCTVEVQGGEGCTPGFWQGGAGSQLWDEANDPDWDGNGTNPFTHDTLFNSFFTLHANLAGLTMFDIVGTGGGSDPVRKAARDVVAAYLNASYGVDIGLTTDDIEDLWTDAVTNETFDELHALLSALNERECPL
jgi:uncharacterized repeat protein (TIGR01451 family)